MDKDHITIDIPTDVDSQKENEAHAACTKANTLDESIIRAPSDHDITTITDPTDQVNPTCSRPVMQLGASEPVIFATTLQQKHKNVLVKSHSRIHFIV